MGLTNSKELEVKLTGQDQPQVQDQDRDQPQTDLFSSLPSLSMSRCVEDAMLKLSDKIISRLEETENTKRNEKILNALKTEASKMREQSLLLDSISNELLGGFYSEINLIGSYKTPVFKGETINVAALNRGNVSFSHDQVNTHSTLVRDG